MDFWSGKCQHSDSPSTITPVFTTMSINIHAGIQTQGLGDANHYITASRLSPYMLLPDKHTTVGLFLINGLFQIFIEVGHSNGNLVSSPFLLNCNSAQIDFIASQLLKMLTVYSTPLTWLNPHATNLTQ